MNLKSSFIFIILIVVPCLACAQQPQSTANVLTKKFSQLPFRETPFADLKGIYPLTKEQAESRKHYELAYDNLGRVIEVKFIQYGKVVPLNIGRNVLTHAPHTKIHYTETHETRTFFNQYGYPATSNGVFKEVYTLDPKGRRVSLSFEDDQGKRISSDWRIYTYEWHIDRRGRVTEQRFNIKKESVEIRPGFPFFCLKLHYDQRGWLAMMENYGKDCKRLTQNKLNAAQDKLVYDRFGAMTSWNVYNEKQERIKGNGPDVAIGIMEYDAFGNTTREYYLDEKANPISNSYGWTNSKAKFDQYGNMTERFNHDKSGNKAKNSTLGYAGYRMKYDAQGIYRVYMAYFDENDQPVSHKIRGYHAVKTEYDDQGRRIRLIFLDKKNQKINRRDNGTAVIEYQYDDHSNIASTVRYDKKGYVID